MRDPIHVCADPNLQEPRPSVQSASRYPNPPSHEARSRDPDLREDPNSRSLKGVPIKYPLVARVPNWGIYPLDPPTGRGLNTYQYYFGGSLL